MRTRWTALLFLAGCGSPSISPPQAPETLEPTETSKRAAFDKGQLALTELGSTLKTQLVSTMADSGPVAALVECSSNAELLTNSVATELGVRVGRSTMRPRNPANRGPDWVEAWLSEQGHRQAEGVTGVESTARRPDGTQIAQVLRPLGIAPPCLVCHGDPETLAPELKAELSARYPNDQATGYALGDLRGAMWAEVEIATGEPR